MSQQSQTLDYFKSHAGDWQRKATSEVYSVIDNRHRAVLETMKKFAAGSTLLDVGCGTGQLAIAASKLGWKAKGVDFAQEMIDLCRKNNSSSNATAQFECASIFDVKPISDSFDIISAQGFIEYISMAQLDQFLDFARTTLKQNGAVAIGSRNRLFNLQTLNDFTELEVALGTIGDLIKEGRILQGAASQEAAVSALKELNLVYDQPTKHPLTGVKVDTRYQFSPADLVTRLASYGLTATCIYPVHFHSLPVSFTDEAAANIHNSLASYASENWISRQGLVPYSSSFVIEAIKK